jgi:hypothetical protein
MTDGERLTESLRALREALLRAAITLPEGLAVHQAAKACGVFCFIDLQIQASLFDLAQTPEAEALAKSAPADDAKFLKSLRIVPDVTPEGH